MMQKKLLVILSIALNSVAYAACQNNIIATAPDNRYQLLNNGAEVKDLNTNLIWQRCSLGQTWSGSSCTGGGGQYNLQGALQAAQNTEGGWRLPNIKELRSLVERSCFSPSVNERIFPNTLAGFYLSSSPTIWAGDAGLNWIISFSDGRDEYDNKNYVKYYTRLVRSE